MSGSKTTPELLKPWDERALRLLLKAIVSAHPDQSGRGDIIRVNEALGALLGRPSKRGAPEKERDELLEMLAFDYSVEVRWRKRKDVTPTEIATKLVEHHPSTSSLAAGKDSIVRDLVRKFKDNEPELMAAHSFDGAEDFDGLYKPLAEAFLSLRMSGIELDVGVLPPGAQRWSREK